MINFIGLGAQKSGTSWAYACLYEHPEICAPIKEIHFFSRPRYVQGLQWYENHFRKCNVKKIKGEFSTSYLYSQEAPERIHTNYPNAKLIAILRNPDDRAVSQYRNSIKSGEITEAISFTQFAAREASVIEQGRYCEQLERYQKYFQKNQMLVLIYEDIKKDPQAFMQSIYRFLGVSDSFVSTMLNQEINIARTPKTVVVDRVMHHVSEFLRRAGFDKLVHNIRKTGLPDFIRAHNTKHVESVAFNREVLEADFQSDVTKLSKLLGRDLNTEWNIPYEAYDSRQHYNPYIVARHQCCVSFVYAQKRAISESSLFS